jgi:hypothetical protein
MATAVLTGTPLAGLAPVTMLVTRAAGRPPIKTLGDPIVMEPVQAVPAIRSPMTAAGWPAIKTLGTPGPVMASPVAVVSPTRAAGNGIVFLLFLQRVN